MFTRKEIALYFCLLRCCSKFGLSPFVLNKERIVVRSELKHGRVIAYFCTLLHILNSIFFLSQAWLQILKQEEPRALLSFLMVVISSACAVVIASLEKYLVEYTQLANNITAIQEVFGKALLLDIIYIYIYNIFLF